MNRSDQVQYEPDLVTYPCNTVFHIHHQSRSSPRDRIHGNLIRVDSCSYGTHNFLHSGSNIPNPILWMLRNRSQVEAHFGARHSSEDKLQVCLRDVRCGRWQSVHEVEYMVY